MKLNAALGKLVAPPLEEPGLLEGLSLRVIALVDLALGMSPKGRWSGTPRCGTTEGPRPLAPGAKGRIDSGKALGIGTLAAARAHHGEPNRHRGAL